MNDGSTYVYLKLVNNRGKADARAIRRSDSSRMAAGGTDSRYADDTRYRTIAQNDWSMGRGEEDLDRNTSKFYDSWNVNTMADGLILGGLATYATGYRYAYSHQPGNVTWRKLYTADGYARFWAATFSATTANGTGATEGIEFIIRRVGTPGTLTAAFYSNSGGSPNALLSSATVTTSTITDTLSVRHLFAITQTISDSTTYWVVLYGAATDTATNHWEIATDATVSTGKYSTDGVTSWIASYRPYFRVTFSADKKYMIARFAEYKSQLYFAAQYDNGGDGALYMNGYRGVADSNTSNLHYLNDSTQTGWTTAGEAGAIVLLHDGAGSTEDQNYRVVATGASGELTVTEAWNDIHLAVGENLTQYVVLNSNKFTLQATPAAYRVYDMLATGDIAWLTYGEGAIPMPVVKWREYPLIQATTLQWRRQYKTDDTLSNVYKIVGVQHPTLGYKLYFAKNQTSYVGDVTLYRASMPRHINENVITAQEYRSSSSYGFMNAATITDLANDAFTRADAALGTTDGGYTIPEADRISAHTGGGSKSWTVNAGTITVVSNKAAGTALTGGLAIATVDVGETNVAVSAAVYVSDGGVVARMADTSNYIRVFVDSTHLYVQKVVATVVTTVSTSTITFVSGARVEAHVSGTRVRAFYNGKQYGGELTISDVALQTGTNCGLFYWAYTTTTIDNFLCYSIDKLVCPPIASNTTEIDDEDGDAEWNFGSHVTIDVANGCGTGLLCYDTVSTTYQDWRRYTKLKIAVKCDKSTALGELQLLLDNNAGCGSPFSTIDLPAFGASVYTEYDVPLDLDAIEDAATVVGAGINLAIAATENFRLTVVFYWMEAETDAIVVGDPGDKITNLIVYGENHDIWIFKQASIWKLDQSADVPELVTAFPELKSSYNGKAACVHSTTDAYLIFSLGRDMIRYFGGTFEDMGLNEGLIPANRRGYPVAAIAITGGQLLVAIDGGTDNYSSVVCYSGGGWHTVYTAPRVGERIRSIYLQGIPGKPSRLWISQGADIVVMPWLDNPYDDPDYTYTWEGAFETAWIYANYQDIIKLYKSFKVFAENLSASHRFINVDWKKDSDTSWTAISSDFDTEPVEEVDLTSNTKGRRIKFRIKLYTDDRTETPRLRSWAAEMTAFLNSKFTYSFMAMIADQTVARDMNDEEDNYYATVQAVMTVLDGWASGGSDRKALTMNSISNLFDSKTVFMESAASVQPWEINAEDQEEQHIIQIQVSDV